MLLLLWKVQSAPPRVSVYNMFHEASASTTINYLTLILCNGASQAEIQQSITNWFLLYLEGRLKQSVGSLVILLFFPWQIFAFLSSPKICEGKIHFLLKKSQKTNSNQACCPWAARMRCHGWSFTCGANVGYVRTNQFSDSAGEAERREY